MPTAMGYFLPSAPDRKCNHLCLQEEIIYHKLVLIYLTQKFKVQQKSNPLGLQVRIPYDCFHRVFYSKLLLLYRQRSLRLLVSRRLNLQLIIITKY